MNFKNHISECIIVFALEIIILGLVNGHGHRPLTAKLKFKLAGRNLIDTDGFTTTDGYVVVYYTNDGGKTSRLLGQTETISNKKNPDWNKMFEFQFDRKLKQYLFFHVYDEDTFRFDDSVGRVWIKVEDYVDKNELAYPNLDKGGYLTIQSAKDDNEYDEEDESIERSSAKKTKKLIPGSLPFRRGTPNSKKIKFKVAVRGLSRNKNNHETLVVTQADGVNGAEKLIGKTSFVTAGFNPVWEHVFSLNWNKVKDQRIHFKIYDGNGEKKLKESDLVGDAWIEANDYIAKGEEFTVLLPDKGSLTMSKVVPKPVKSKQRASLEHKTASKVNHGHG